MTVIAIFIHLILENKGSSNNNYSSHYKINIPIIRIDLNKKNYVYLKIVIFDCVCTTVSGFENNDIFFQFSAANNAQFDGKWQQ